MSSDDPLFPLNWLVVAARFTRSADFPRAFRVAAPNFKPSSQNTTRMPRAAAENGTKPTLTASDIGYSSKNQGFASGAGWLGGPPRQTGASLQDSGPRQRILAL